MTAKNIAAIILAAGSSTRFGKDNKLLAPFDGKPIILRVIENIERAGISLIIIVTGFEGDKVREALNNKNAAFITNPNFEEGMASSISVGIKALPQGCDGALVALGDMPNVLPDTIRALIEAKVEVDGKIIIPTFDGQRGNPVLWHRDMFARLMSIEGDTGGKQIISRHPDNVTEVPVDDPGILFDIDTKQELDRD